MFIFKIQIEIFKKHRCKDAGYTIRSILKTLDLTDYSLTSRGSKRGDFSGTSTKLFFLDAPPGTCKTFLINLVIAKNKIAGKEQLALSGIAATLLLSGRTAHFIFKIPIKIRENSIL